MAVNDINVKSKLNSTLLTDDEKVGQVSFWGRLLLPFT